MDDTNNNAGMPATDTGMTNEETTQNPVQSPMPATEDEETSTEESAEGEEASQ